MRLQLASGARARRTTPAGGVWASAAVRLRRITQRSRRPLSRLCCAHLCLALSCYHTRAPCSSHSPGLREGGSHTRWWHCGAGGPHPLSVARLPLSTLPRPPPLCSALCHPSAAGDVDRAPLRPHTAPLPTLLHHLPSHLPSPSSSSSVAPARGRALKVGCWWRSSVAMYWAPRTAQPWMTPSSPACRRGTRRRVAFSPAWRWCTSPSAPS